jgi:vacuolar-type H+-ATPase subunit H
MADLAASEAVHVGQSAKQAGDRVVQTAVGQARELAAEATDQARGLLEECRQQLREQVASQQEKVALRLANVADDVREMAHASRSAPVSELADHGAESLHQLASWFKDQQPEELLEHARSFARRRPGVFMLGATLAGVVAGRLTSSGITAVRQSNDTGLTPQRIAPPAPPPPATPPPRADQSRTVTDAPQARAAGSGHGAALARHPMVHPGTSPENSSTRAGSGTAYLAPPPPRSPLDSATRTRSPRDVTDEDISPYLTSRDATIPVATLGGDAR